MEEALIAALLADPGVAAIAGTRVTPWRRMQGAALPALTLLRIGGTPLQTHAGPVPLARARVQIDAWAESYAAAKTLARAAARALDAAASPTGTIRAVLRLDQRDAPDAEGKILRVSLDFDIWHQEI